MTLYQNCSKRFAPMNKWGGAMVLGKLPVPGRPTIWITVGQGPTTLTVQGEGCLEIFTPSLWETARYRLNTVLKGR